MPVWHEQTSQLVADGKLVVLGVTQEQHPERCRLFAQWKGLDFPILHDPINLMGVTKVPIYVAIDEHGIVRATPRRSRGFEDAFVNQTFDAPRKKPKTGPTELPEPRRTSRHAGEERSVEAWRAHGDAIILAHKPRMLNEAIEAYQTAIARKKRDADSHFRLGVAYRMRYDLGKRRPDDFQNAVDAWRDALKLDKNQYIFRRRIQQYGPRLDKPYPFYDWVAQARQEITARGETPIELVAEPVGAELAGRAREFETTADAGPEGDPDGEINRDEKKLVDIESIVVRHSDTKRRVAQVHVTFRPNRRSGGHWNNEAEPLRIWLDAPKKKGVKLSRRFVEFANPSGAAVTDEVRSLDFEVELPKTRKGSLKIPGYALYNVCEGRDGKCQFLRLDFEIKVRLK